MLQATRRNLLGAFILMVVFVLGNELRTTTRLDHVDPCAKASRLPRWSDSNLPKKLHQQWWPGNISGMHALWANNTRNVFADLQYKLWTIHDMREHIATHYSWFIPIYDAYRSDMFRADAARYFVLHYFGGVYLDTDYEVKIHFYDFLDPDRPTFVESPFMISETHITAVMASPARDPFWNTLFDVLYERRNAMNVVYATGPGALSEAIRRNHRHHTLPCEMFHRVPIGIYGKHSPVSTRYFREFMTRTRFVRPCGSLATHTSCLYGIHYNTVLWQT